MLKAIFVVALLCLASPAGAQTFSGDRYVSTSPAAVHVSKRHSAVTSRDTRTVGSRPRGCPALFCGCALALRIFGRLEPSLYLVRNWIARFPRAAAAPGMVAARSGHAFLLLEHKGGLVWNAWDPNSGHRQTRIHERSIAGFVIVNPRVGRVAGL